MDLKATLASGSKLETFISLLFIFQLIPLCNFNSSICSFSFGENAKTTCTLHIVDLCNCHDWALIAARNERFYNTL